MIQTWNSRDKGKARAIPRDEGAGGTDGVVVPLDVVNGGIYDIAYTITVHVGEDNQQLSLQVDTGSSDLWIASSSCSSSVCSQANGHVYDPTGSRSTDQTFSINYLQGNVSGPIVWDKIEIGGYSIENQALAAADTITNEPISPSFNGILGLALPLNSVIAGLIAPVTTNSPDGAAWASNLFSITPVTSAPAARFLSLSLSRPGSDRIPSLLGIGRHPAQLVTDPKQIHYSTLVSERSGTLFWKVGVRAITVYVDGQPRPVQIGRSNSGAVFPSAVLDSGVPLILTTSAVANGIYGAIGVNPGSDGQYYVPCNTPLNMTITLDDRPELPLHPLDLTAEPNGNSAQFCIGLIQSADAVLAVADSRVGDMILGVPFLRNAYTVMAYVVPDSDGTFPDNASDNGTQPSDVDADNRPIRPRLGLLGLTDPTTALDEFNKVRVLNQPIGSDSSGVGGGAVGSVGSGKRLSVGIIVLIGLLGFFALCFALFATRWFVFRRRYRRDGRTVAVGAAVDGAGAGSRRGEKEFGVYMLARRGSRGSRDVDEDGRPTEDVLRALRFEAYMKEASEYTVSSGKTHVVDVDDSAAAVEGGDAEMGYRRRKADVGRGEDPWEPTSALGWGGATLVSGTADQASAHRQDDLEDNSSPERSYHQRTTSEAAARRASPHNRTLSVALPLLPHVADTDERTIDPPGVDQLGADEFGLASGASMAGIGTAARGGKIDPAFRSSIASTSSVADDGGLVEGVLASEMEADHASPMVSRGRLGRVASGPRMSTASMYSQTSSPRRAEPDD